MAQKTKKRNPGGILEWLVDFFVSPIAKPIADIVTKVNSMVMSMSIDEMGNRTTVIQAGIDKTYKTGLAVHSPMTPSDALLLTDGWRKEQRDHWYELYLSALLIEGGSLGQVEGQATMLFQEPQVRASLELATNWYAAPYQVGVQPYLNRYWLKAYTPLLPESYRLALAAAKGIIDDEVYKDAMAQSGLNDFWADAWREQNYEYPAVAMVFEMYWRKLIDDESFDTLLQRLGYHWGVWDEIKELTKLIPPAPDLITMVVREAFLPEMVTPAPDVFASYMGMKGFSKEWADRYWTAHWVPIPLAQAYDNLYRGYWTKDDFEFALRIADIHPMWRDDIYNVAFRPPSIREMGYGWDMGVYTREDIVRYRRWGGLSPEDAEKAADSMIKYRTSAETEAVRREYLTAFAYGRINVDAFMDALENLQTPPDSVLLWVERGQLMRERLKTGDIVTEYRIVTSTEALWAFKHDLRSEGWLRQRLQALEWDDERVNLAIERAKWEIFEETPQPGEEDYRNLTITQLRMLFDAKLITHDIFVEKLQLMGYSTDDARVLMELYIKIPLEAVAYKPYTDAWSRNLYAYRILGYNELLENYKALGYDDQHAYNMVLATILSEEYPALSAVYRKGYINEETFLRELVKLGMEGEDAIELIERTIRDYQYERIEREKELTKAEIIKGVKNEIIGYSEGVSLLEDIGYEDWEAAYILDINKVVAASDPESYWEMRKVVESYKRARGEPYVDIPEEVFMLDREMRAKKAEIEKLREEQAGEVAISKAESEYADIKARLRKVLVVRGIG